MSPLKKTLLGLGITAMLGACSSPQPSLLNERLKDFEGAPRNEQPHQQTGSSREPAGEQVELSTDEQSRWWIQLGSMQLNRLIEEALRENFSIQAAALRLEEAKGVSRASWWQLGPKMSANASQSTSKVLQYDTNQFYWTRPAQRATSTRTSGIQASWEVPLFGKAAAILAQGQAQKELAFWSLHGARLAVSTEVASAYVELQAAIATAPMLQAALDLAVQAEHAQETMLQKGVATADALVQAQSQTQALREQQADNAQSRHKALARLEALLGHPNEAVLSPYRALHATSDPDLFAKRQLSFEPVAPNAMRRRPDVLMAEARVAQAGAQAGIARANLYPQFTLQASISQTEGNLDALGANKGLSRLSGSSVGLHIPLLDWFSLKAEADARVLEMKAVVQDYRQTLVAAWQEVQEAQAQAEAARIRLDLAALQKARAQTQLERHESALHAGLEAIPVLVPVALQRHSAFLKLEQAKVDLYLAWLKWIRAKNQ